MTTTGSGDARPHAFTRAGEGTGELAGPSHHSPTTAIDESAGPRMLVRTTTGPKAVEGPYGRGALVVTQSATRGGRWVVTHARTRRRVGDYCYATREAAEAVISEIDGMAPWGLDWKAWRAWVHEDNREAPGRLEFAVELVARKHGATQDSLS